jgi:hypothetical protein
MLSYFMPFGIFYGHLVQFSVLECLDQEKSGNPGLKAVGGLAPNSGMTLIDLFEQNFFSIKRT